MPELVGQLDEGDFAPDLNTSVKFSAVAEFFKKNPQTLRTYRYIMLPDDDLLFDDGAISRLFKICSDFDLAVAQPALRSSSHISHPIVLECPDFFLRYTNFIEAMAPIIASDYLAALLGAFDRWPTGWGIDEVWALLMSKPAFASAIIDSEPVLHLRPHASGEIYRSFASLGMDPQRDLRQIRSSFHNSTQGKRVYGGILHSGRKIGSLRSNVANGLYLISAAKATREPARVRRTGLGMLARSVTSIHYRPVSLVPLDSETKALKEGVAA